MIYDWNKCYIENGNQKEKDPMIKDSSSDRASRMGSALSRKGRLTRMRAYIPLYIMLLPALVYVMINNYLPMGGLVLAFKQFNAGKGIFGSDWNHFANFDFLLKNRSLPLFLRNTVCYNLVFIVINMVVGVFLALAITEIRGKRMRQFSQSIILFPFVVSIIIISYMVRGFLDFNTGLFNSLLKSMGRTPVNWYMEKKYWPAILVFVNMWKSVGYGCLLYIAALLGIDPSLYEAASISGASRLQQIWYITLPHLAPTCVTLALLSVGHIFNSDFGLFYQVPQNSGIIASVTQTIDTFVYKSMATNVGMSAAASFFQSAGGFVLILFFNWVARRVSRENALF